MLFSIFFFLWLSLDVIVDLFDHQSDLLLLILLLLQQFTLVNSHLLGHLLTHLDLLLQILQHSSFVEEHLESRLQASTVWRSGRDVHFPLWENGILSIH
jgi:hypothetical protein